MPVSSLTKRSRFIFAAQLVFAFMVMFGAYFAVATHDADTPSLEYLEQRRPEWCEHWSMESRISQSQLVLVARVSNISEVNIVQGAKVNTALREYRFQPVSVLKGVFTRDELAMTDSDLGLPAPDPTAKPPFKHGEHILLILTRTRGNYGCVSLGRGQNNPRQLIPRLIDRDDPIVSMTQTMIQVSQASSRQRRVELSIESLDQASGPSAVPLLLSLGTRAYWVQHTDAAKTLARLTLDESPAVRAAAAGTISQVLASGAPIKNESRTIFAEALRDLLASKGAETQLRVAAIQGLGSLHEFGRQTDWVSKLLVRNLHHARTNAERGAALTALGALKDPTTTEVLLNELKRLPLDEVAKREIVFINAAVGLAKDKAAPVLLDRLKEKLDAGHAAYQEIGQLGKLKHHTAMPLLLQAARDGKHRDEAHLASAFEQLRDDRAIPVLAQWIASTNYDIRLAAINALDAFDGKDAVAAIRLRLKSEPDLRLKLRMAEVLGRHGFNDGYAIALEHLADPGITPFAAKALAAIGDERTAGHLWKILETSNDTQWSGAALLGLASLRDEKVRDRLDEILSARRSPLLQSAIVAAHELGDPTLIPSIVPYLLSRNYKVSDGSILAIRYLASKVQSNPKYRKSIDNTGAALLEVLNEPDVPVKLRLAALEALRSLKDNRLPRALKALADRSQLENSQLMKSIDRALATS